MARTLRLRSQRPAPHFDWKNTGKKSSVSPQSDVLMAVPAASGKWCPSRLVCMVLARPRPWCTRNPYFSRPLKVALTLRPFTWFKKKLLFRCGVAPLLSGSNNEGLALRRFCRFFVTSQTAAEWHRFYEALAPAGALRGPSGLHLLHNYSVYVVHL